MPLTSQPIGRRGGMLAPQRKPWGSIGHYELDPRAPLSAGLTMAMIPDGPQGVGGLYDYAAPERTFRIGQGTPTFTTGQFGNQVNLGFGTSAAINFSPTVPATNTSASVSCLVQFDGSGHGDLGNVLLSDGFVSNEIFGTNTSLNSPLLWGGVTNTAKSTAVFVALLNGWHRIGVTVNGTIVRFFLDGVFQDQQTTSGTITAGAAQQILADAGEGSFSWGWNVADLFYWNRPLSDLDMMRNFVSPYRSILRPRFSDSNIVGPNTSPRKGSLMLLGVG